MEMIQVASFLGHFYLFELKFPELIEFECTCFNSKLKCNLSNENIRLQTSTIDIRWFEGKPLKTFQFTRYVMTNYRDKKCYIWFQ